MYPSQPRTGLNTSGGTARALDAIPAGQREVGGHVASIQILRGIAALLVLFYHCGTLYAVKTETLLFGNVFRSGYVGVDIFFVLSGFVIFMLHRNDVGRPERLKIYLKKRFARVVPLYWLIVVAKAIKDGGGASWTTLLCAFLLLPYPVPPYINVAWTLTFEIIFYLVFAIAIILPRGYVSLLPVGMLLWLGLAPTPFPAPAFPAQVMFNFLFDNHILEFLFGIAACAAAPKLSISWARWLFSVGVVTVVAFFVVAGVLSFNPQVAPLVGAAYRIAEMESNIILENKLLLVALPTALILASASALERLNAINPMHLLGWIGDISYALYLTHAFVVYFALSWTPFRQAAMQSQASMLSVMLLCIVIAGIVHSFVEKPLISWTRRLLQT